MCYCFTRCIMYMHFTLDMQTLYIKAERFLVTRVLRVYIRLFTKLCPQTEENISLCFHLSPLWNPGAQELKGGERCRIRTLHTVKNLNSFTNCKVKPFYYGSLGRSPTAENTEPLPRSVDKGRS